MSYAPKNGGGKYTLPPLGVEAGTAAIAALIGPLSSPPEPTGARVDLAPVARKGTGEASPEWSASVGTALNFNRNRIGISSGKRYEESGGRLQRDRKRGKCPAWIQIEAVWACPENNRPMIGQGGGAHGISWRNFANALSSRREPVRNEP